MGARAMVETKERPLLMSGPMVRAVLEGRKTQTRRVVKPQPIDPNPLMAAGMLPSHIVPQAQHHNAGIRCRYGAVGDRLWVREAWAKYAWQMASNNGVGVGATTRIIYRADEDATLYTDARWYPSIHMARSHSRLTLEITGVKVERVQDISEADAKAEGLMTQEGDGGKPGAGCKWTGTGYHGGRVGQGGKCFHVAEHNGTRCRCKVGGPTPAQCAFRELWNRLNAKRGYSWDSNPWVWVLSFAVIPYA